MTDINVLVIRVKEFRTRHLIAAKDLRTKGAPIEQINHRLTLAFNATAMLERYIMNINGAEDSLAELNSFLDSH